MIDVPVLVRDALRDGRRRKNYRFTVQDKITTRHIIPIATFDDDARTYTIGSYPMLYMRIGAEQPTTTVVGQVNFPNSSGHYPITIEHTNGTETFEKIGQFREFSEFDFSAFLGTMPEMELTAENLISYTESYVDDYVIDNNTLVSESVKFDERMCSGDVIKFGLCEGSSLEFQYFDHPNIKDRRLFAEIDVEYDVPPDWSTEKTFTDSEDRYTCQQDGQYRVHIDATGVRITVEVYRMGQAIYSISAYTMQNITLKERLAGDVVVIKSLSGTTTSHLSIQRWAETDWHTIPMGYFDVAQCSMQFSTGIQKITAYNKLKSKYLDEKANTVIEKMNSDVGDPDMVTIQTVMDLLLEDYAIKVPQPETPLTVINDGSTMITSWSDWTFKFNGETTSRKVRFGHDTDATNYDGTQSSYLLGKRLDFDIRRYLEDLHRNIWDFKTYVYQNIQNPDAFWARLKQEAIKEAGMTVYVDRGTGFEYYLIDDCLPENGLKGDMHPVMSLDKLRYLQDIKQFHCHFLNYFGYESSGQYVWTYRYEHDFTIYNKPKVYESDMDSVGSIEINKTKLADVTLRDIVSANYELKCQYGKLDRETDLFAGVELNNQWLFPAEDLYPDNNLYPGGGGLPSASAFRSTYSKLWTDSQGQQSFRYLIIKYKGLDDQDKETEYTYTKLINENGTIDYNMTDNWLFKNLIWTEADVIDYATAMVAKLQNVTWIPFEMWAAGLPYIETGDEVEIILGQNTFKTYVLQRQLSGIQNLQDTYINGTLDIF